MSLENVGRRFESKFKTTDGHYFHGDLLDIKDPANFGLFGPARRELRVRSRAAVKAGDMFYTTTGRTYLAADNGEALSYNKTLYRSFKLYEMTHTLLWQRDIRTEDPVTGIMSGTGLTDVGDGELICLFEPLDDQSGELKVPTESFRVITGSEVLAGDHVGDYVVQRVEFFSGAYVAEVR